jgi:uncharacterized protein YciI
MRSDQDPGSFGRRAFIAVGLSATAGLSASAAAEPLRPTYIVIFSPGPSWLAGKPLAEQPLREHGRYMLSLFDRGLLKLAGGFADQSGGCAVIEADSDASASDIANADPAVRAGTFVYALHRWNLVDWQALNKSQSR